MAPDASVTALAVHGPRAAPALSALQALPLKTFRTSGAQRTIQPDAEALLPRRLDSSFPRPFETLMPALPQPPCERLCALQVLHLRCLSVKPPSAMPSTHSLSLLISATLSA
jgi:hypothetical protein